MMVRISADSSKLNQSLKSVQGDLTSTQKGFASFEKAAGVAFKAVGLAASAAAIAVGAAFGKAVKMAADFEQGVADIGAVMNLTGKEAEGLQDHIMDLGLDPKLK